MLRLEQAQTVADALFKAEADIDQALSGSCELIQIMSAIRRDHRYSAVLGSDAYDSVTQAVRAIGKARKAMVRAHGALDSASAQIGVDPGRLQGPFLDKPPKDVPIRNQSAIRAVG